MREMRMILMLQPTYDAQTHVRWNYDEYLGEGGIVQSVLGSWDADLEIRADHSEAEFPEELELPMVGAEGVVGGMFLWAKVGVERKSYRDGTGESRADYQPIKRMEDGMENTNDALASQVGEKPICGDSQHRHIGACELYTSQVGESER